MTDYSLPAHKESRALLRQYHVPPHIVRHSLAAAKLAVFLAKRLKDKGVAVDIDMVERACLLHGTAAQSEINTAKVDPLIFKLEKEIFEKIALDPAEVTEQLIDAY